jgi:ribonuclease J
VEDLTDSALNGPSVDLIPLGGVGEIGLNCLAVVYGQDIVVVDAGLMFPEANQPGVELVIPDFTFLRDHSDQVRAVILTHGHEDHIGALAYLLKDLDVPVFGTRLTLALARARLEEIRTPCRKFMEIKPRDTLTLGPFQIEFIAVNHSIIDGLALAITTPVGVIIHTGDFKIDSSAPAEERLDLYSFASYGEKGVLALLSDSTNAEVPGFSISEGEVGRTLTDIFTKAEGRIIMACFASSLTRLRQAALAAKASNRKLLFDGRNMVNNAALARELGYLPLTDDDIVDIQNAQYLNDQQVAMVVTGSQGEPLSALARMAHGEHKHVVVRKGDTIIFSARVIPGNERACANLINLFHGLGVTVIDDRICRVHASGHGHIEELKLMLALTRPRYLVPIHGEPQHLVNHALLAAEWGLKKEQIKLLTNGQRLELYPDGQAALGSPVRTGRLLVDGNRLGSAHDPVIRRRLKMADTGLVYIIAVLEKNNLIPLAPVKINIHGVHYENEPDLTLEAASVAGQTIMFWRDEQDYENPDTNQLVEMLKLDLRAVFKQSINRKPIIWSEIIYIDTLKINHEDLLEHLGY